MFQAKVNIYFSFVEVSLEPLTVYAVSFIPKYKVESETFIICA